MERCARPEPVRNHALALALHADAYRQRLSHGVPSWSPSSLLGSPGQASNTAMTSAHVEKSPQLYWSREQSVAAAGVVDVGGGPAVEPAG